MRSARRLEAPAKFKHLVEAYAASHGDVRHPALVALRTQIVRWLAWSEADYFGHYQERRKAPAFRPGI